MLGSMGRLRSLRVVRGSVHGVRAVDVAQRTGLTIAGAQRALMSLAGTGIIVQIVQGRGAVYRWNEEHPFASLLAALFDSERQRRTAVQDAAVNWLETAHAHPLALWWFGSSARGTDTFESDVDLMIVGPDDRTATQAIANTLEETLAPVGIRFALRPNIIAYTTADFHTLPEKDPTMWANLISDAIVLHGPTPERLYEQLAMPHSANSSPNARS